MPANDLTTRVIARCFKELGEFIGKKFENITTAIGSIKPYNDAKVLIAIGELAKTIVANKTTITTQATDLAPAIQAIKELSAKLDIPEPLPHTDIINALQDLQAAVLDTALDPADVAPTYSPTIEVPPIDLSGITQPIIAAIKANKPEPTSIDLSPILEALSGLATELKKKPKELPVKFDDMQMRALRNLGGGGGGSGPLMATKIAPVVNLALTDHNIQYSYTFPANTLAWIIKLRDQGTLLYYAFETGKLPNSGSGSAYMTTPQNFLRSQAGIEWSGKTIYLGAETDGQIAEIEVYTL